ncbi:MAG: PEP-CTERM sorting domain-containing protein [Rubripirellula sp.]
MRFLSILTFLFSVALINPAYAGVLIEFDLSVTNQLTLTATTGTALASATGNTGTGIVLEGTGELTGDSLGDDSDTFGFQSTGALSRVKLNRINASGVYSIDLFEQLFSDSINTSITQGQQAFVGTSTITLDATEYANLLNAPNSGKIYAFADSPSYATVGTYIGDWAKASSGTVPEPSTAIAMGLLGVLGFAGNRRRRLGVAKA